MAEPTRDEPLAALVARAPQTRLDASGVKRALGLESAWLAGLVHRYFDRDGDGAVTAAELHAGMRAAASGDEMARMKFTFALFDQDGNGLVDRDEFERLVAISLAENGVVMPPAWIESTVAGVFRDADLDGDGLVTFGEFAAAVGRVQGMRAVTARGALPRATSDVTSPDGWWSEHGRLAVVAALFALANVTAFTVAALEYRAAGAHALVQVARGFGRVLDLALLLLLLPVLRAVVTRLRQTPLSRMIPLDDTLGMHRAVGHVVGVASVGHGLAHLANQQRLGALPRVLWTQLAMGTGALLLAVGLVMWAGAHPAVRRSHRFELFWRTHRAWALYLALCLLHTPRLHPWMALPVTLLALELAVRRLRRVRATRALALDPLASGVTRVVLARPEGFRHRAGDYVYLRVPSVAAGEWHPFTVSSAPERPDVITLHVRSLGNWTRALHDLAQTRARVGAKLPLEAELDGPYGTPAAHIFAARVPVLVAAGIGVTPFAAILESLLYRARGVGREGGDVAVERVYFVWVARDQFAFEWFAELLAAVEASEVSARFEVLIYMTGARVDAASEGAALALDLAYARTSTDPLTGLRARTRFGAPDWSALLGAIAARHPSPPAEVFFCGPDGLARTVAHAAAARAMPFRQEHF